MIYRLIILNGDRRGEQVTVAPEPMKIGKDTACDIRLSDPEVALIHAEIIHQPSGLEIRDLGSMNRILVNHREVRESRLKHGDVIEIGQTRLLVQAHVQAEVQGEIPVDDDEEKSQRRKQWMLAGSLILLIVGMVIGIPRCERLLIAPRSRDIKPDTLPQTPMRTKTESGRSLPAAPAITIPTKTNPPAVTLIPQSVTPPQQPQPVPDRVKPTPPPEPVAATPAPALEPKPVISEPNPKPIESVSPVPTVKPNATSELIDRSQQELQAAATFLETHIPPGDTQTVSTLSTPAQSSTAPAADTLSSPAKPIVPESPKSTPITTTQPRVKTETPLQPVKDLIKITGTDISKFPETEQFREMRLLTIRLTTTGVLKELDGNGVRIEVMFVDRDKTTGRVSPASPGKPPSTLTVKGSWHAQEQKTVVASYVVPVTNPPMERSAQYHGFLVRVFYHGILQDELIQPQDLPPEILTPAGASSGAAASP